MEAQSSLGIQFGSLRMGADIPGETQLLNQIGFSLQHKPSIKTTISFVLSRGRTSGFDYNSWSHYDEGGGLTGDLFQFLNLGQKWYPNYVLSNTSLKAQFEFSPFETENEHFSQKILPFVFGGIGLAYHQTNINLLDEDKNHYLIFEEDQILSIQQIREQFDDTYETALTNTNGFSPLVTLGIGINYQISKIWNVLLSGEYTTVFRDDLDGILLKNNALPSNNSDILYLYQFEIRRSF